MSSDDLIVAFYPCIYFTGSVNPCYFRLNNTNYRMLDTATKYKKILERADYRNEFYKRLYRLIAVCDLKGFRIVFENPVSGGSYLQNNFLKEPDIIDVDRTKRGDFFKKPTGYWFFNCIPTCGESFQKDKVSKRVWDCKSATEAGLCSEERSLISSDYARNWICDFILGKVQSNSQLSFNFE